MADISVVPMDPAVNIVTVKAAVAQGNGISQAGSTKGSGGGFASALKTATSTKDESSAGQQADNEDQALQRILFAGLMAGAMLTASTAGINNSVATETQNDAQGATVNTMPAQNTAASQQGIVASSGTLATAEQNLVGMLLQSAKASGEVIPTSSNNGQQVATNVAASATGSKNDVTVLLAQMKVTTENKAGQVGKFSGIPAGPLQANTGLTDTIPTTKEPPPGVADVVKEMTQSNPGNIVGAFLGQQTKAVTTNKEQDGAISLEPKMNTGNTAVVASLLTVFDKGDKGANILLSSDKNDQPAEKQADTSIQSPFVNLLEQQKAVQSAQLTTETAKQSDAQHTVNPYDVMAQIVDKAKLVSGQNNSEMVIQLKPEHLGELTLKVTVDDGGVVSASFHSNNSEVRSMLEASLPQLKQEMFDQGLKVDNVGVYAGLGQFFSGNQRETYQQQPQVKVSNKKAEKDFVEGLDSVQPEPTKVAEATDGVDYRV